MKVEYKNNININQRAAIELGLNVDIIDLAIFDYIRSFVLSGKCMHVQTDDGLFYWVSHKNIQEAMPLLGIRTPRGIINRIKNLIDAGLILRYARCDEFGKTLYAFGPNYTKMEFFETPPENLFRGEKNDSGVGKSVQDNNIVLSNDSTSIDNNNICTIENNPSTIPPIVPQPAKRFTPPTLDEVTAYCESRHNDVNPQRFIAYYESNGWKVGRNPMKDWRAAVRTWEAKEVKRTNTIDYGHTNNSGGYAAAGTAGQTRERNYDFQF